MTDPAYRPIRSAADADDAKDKRGLASGLILILTGVAFYLRQPIHFAYQPDHWWALFMFVPVIQAITPNARGRRNFRWYAGIMCAGMGLIMLFTPNLGQSWPLVVMLTGFALL
jgi:hypothetical protein